MGFFGIFAVIIAIVAIIVGFVFFRVVFVKYSILVGLLACAYIILAYGVTKYQEG